MGTGEGLMPASLWRVKNGPVGQVGLLSPVHTPPISSLPSSQEPAIQMAATSRSCLKREGWGGRGREEENPRQKKVNLADGGDEQREAKEGITIKQENSRRSGECPTVHIYQP